MKHTARHTKRRLWTALLLMMATSAAFAQDAPPPALRVVGRLVDTQGVPVAGARVLVVPPVYAIATLGVHGLYRQAMNQRDLSGLAQAVTESDGVYRIPVGAGGLALHSLRDPGNTTDPDTTTCSVVMHADGLQLRAVRITLPEKGIVQVENLTLKPGRSLSVEVVDTQQRPLSTARLTLLEAPTVAGGHPPEVQALCRELLQARADSQGRCELTSLGNGRYHVTLTVPGYESYRTRLKTGMPGDLTDLGRIELVNGGSLHGLVVDELGSPLPDVTLRIQRPEIWKSERELQRPLRKAPPAEIVVPPLRTDARGGFHVHSLPWGHFDVLADSWGYLPTVNRSTRPGGDPIILSMKRQATLVISLVDAETGAPVEDATLLPRRSVNPADRSRHRLMPLEVRRGSRPGPDLGLPELGPGTWLVGPASTGYQDVVVSAPGYLRETHELPGVPAGECLPVRLELRRAASLSGRITDDAGQPLEGVRVVCHTLSDGHSALARTDADGHYERTGLFAGVWRVSVNGVGWNQPEQTLRLQPGDRNRLDASLHRVSELRGQVQTSLGAEVLADVTIVTEGTHDRKGARSARSGAFRIGDIPPGGLTVVARSEYGASLPVHLSLAEMEVAQLTMPLGTATLRGRVIDAATHQPVPQCGVGLRRLDVPSMLAERATPWWRTTDRAGTYQFPGLPAGLYELILVEHSGRELSPSCMTLSRTTGGPAIVEIPDEAYTVCEMPVVLAVRGRS